MLNNKELEYFFEKLNKTHPTIHPISYDRYRIINEICSATNIAEKIRELFEKEKDFIFDDETIQYYLMSNKNTPTDIAVEIFKNSISVPTALKVLERDDIAMLEDRDKIYKSIYNSLFPETIKEYLCATSNLYKNWVLVTEEPCNRNITQGALQFLSKQEDLNYLPVALLTDDKFVEKLIETNPSNERLRAIVVNNTKLGDDIRNKAFDDGCDIEKVKNGTPYIISSVYESAMDTLSIVEDVNSPTYVRAKRLLERLIQNDVLGEAQQLDAVMRYVAEKRNGYNAVYSDISRKTKYESVMNKIIKEIGRGDPNHPAIDRIYFTSKVPNDLLRKRAEYIINSIKGNQFFGLETEKIIYKALDRECLKKRDSYDIILSCNHYGFNHALAQDSQAPNDVLRELIKKCKGTNQYSTMLIAAINIGMNKESNIGKNKSLLFRKSVQSIIDMSPKDLMSVLNGGSINGLFPIYNHNLREINEKAYIEYLESAKEELKIEPELQDFMEKWIKIQKESFERDKLYEKINLFITDYKGGEKNYIEFRQDCMQYVFLNSASSLESVFSKLSLGELRVLEEKIINSIPHLNSDINHLETYTHFYENVDNYVKVNNLLEKYIIEKEFEMELEKSEEER